MLPRGHLNPPGDWERAQRGGGRVVVKGRSVDVDRGVHEDMNKTISRLASFGYSQDR